MVDPEADHHNPPLGEIDYSRVPEGSVWGSPNPQTLALCRTHFPGQIILEPAAGDSRYGVDVLEYADYVVANDIDRASLSRMESRTPQTLRQKLRKDIYKIPGRLPYADNTFGGVLNTGFLYLYPPEIVEQMAREIHRVLKPDGTFILEFLTDRERREIGTGRPVVGEDESTYTLEGGRTLLVQTFRSQFRNFSLEVHPVDTTVHVPLMGGDDIHYHLTGNLIIAAARK